MGSVIGIPTTRVSDSFIRQRLMSQLQLGQLAMFDLQTQLSTGYRIQSPSQDADAAMRIMGLQRLLERKEQVQTNVATSQSYLTATDTALSGISGMLADVRSTALSVLDTTTTDVQRNAARQEVEQAIQQLLDAGNQKFRGRYLFAGTNTSLRPFEQTDSNAVKYNGNEGRLQSYSDIDLLFDTNLDGNEVFGTISEPVSGTADLTPALGFDTRLADLRSGRGISGGTIAVAIGEQTSTIDLAGAETIGDLALMIRNNPPEGKRLQVEVNATGLVIEPLCAPGELMTIRDVGGGTTADELGILTDTATADPVVGDDLDPIVRLTTRLDDILGTRSRTVVHSSGSDNDIIFEADTVGTEFDGIDIVFLDDGSVVSPGDDEKASYDLFNRTLTVTVKTDYTRAQHIVAAVQSAYADGLSPLTARLDPLDEQDDGHGIVAVPAGGTPVGTTAQGSGKAFDKTSGVQIVNANQTHIISLEEAETIEDVLNILNNSGAGVLAEINQNATGINVRSTLSGCDFMIGENGGDAATELGLRTFGRTTRLDDLDHGRGAADTEGTDFTITTADGQEIEIDISGLETVGDVLDAINAAAPAGLTARLAALGNGIELVDDTGGPGTLAVSRSSGSFAAIDLGLMLGGDQYIEPYIPLPGGPQILAGVDSNPQETNGVFTALLRLTDALEANDLGEVERSIELLDAQMVGLNFARAELGARQQGLDTMQTRLDSEDIDLQTAISDDYDADLVEVISDLTGRQIAFQASLQSSAAIFQMTLLDYL